MKPVPHKGDEQVLERWEHDIWWLKYRPWLHRPVWLWHLQAHQSVLGRRRKTDMQRPPAELVPVLVCVDWFCRRNRCF